MFEFEGVIYTLAEMLWDNRDDEELCEWLQSAAVGDRFYGHDLVRVA